MDAAGGEEREDETNNKEREESESERNKWGIKTKGGNDLTWREREADKRARRRKRASVRAGEREKGKGGRKRASTLRRHLQLPHTNGDGKERRELNGTSFA